MKDFLFFLSMKLLIFLSAPENSRKSGKTQEMRRVNSQTKLCLRYLAQRINKEDASILFLLHKVILSVAGIKCLDSDPFFSVYWFELSGQDSVTSI